MGITTSGSLQLRYTSFKFALVLRRIPPTVLAFGQLFGATRVTNSRSRSKLQLASFLLDFLLGFVIRYALGALF